jgi:hypothetical protein
MAKGKGQMSKARIARLPICHLAFAICHLACLLPLCGCASATAHGFNPTLNGDDLIKMTDLMAESIAGDSKVQDAIAREGKLAVVVQPVENYLRGEVIPRGPAEAFTGRVRTLLARHDADHFIWVMNRDAFYDLRQRELEGIDPGPSPDAINPQYALTAKFSSLAHVSSKGRTDYYLCVYELTNLHDRTVLWTGSYEVKKQAVKGMLD